MLLIKMDDVVCNFVMNKQTNKTKKTNTKQAAMSSIYLTRMSCQLNLTVTI